MNTIQSTMKQIHKVLLAVCLTVSSGASMLSCIDSKNNPEKSTQSDNIPPSDVDETRYNLSEQQKLSMQKDTTLVDTANNKDSISGPTR